jgi:two-component system sensor histidine kinase VicK
MFSSIKWRFTIIYFILIFVALITAGIFIVQAFEDYHLGTVEKKLDDLSQLVLPKIEALETFNPEDIQQIIETHQGLGFDEEIYIVNDQDQIIASSTETQSNTASNVLDLSLLISARNGKSETAIAAIKNYDVRTMDLSMPIQMNENFVGILFIRHNLDAIYTTLSKTTMIIVRAILLASFFTVFISFLIAKTISSYSLFINSCIGLSNCPSPNL